MADNLKPQQKTLANSTIRSTASKSALKEYEEFQEEQQKLQEAQAKANHKDVVLDVGKVTNYEQSLQINISKNKEKLQKINTDIKMLESKKNLSVEEKEVLDNLYKKKDKLGGKLERLQLKNANRNTVLDMDKYNVSRSERNDYYQNRTKVFNQAANIYEAKGNEVKSRIDGLLAEREELIKARDTEISKNKTTPKEAKKLLQEYDKKIKEIDKSVKKDTKEMNGYLNKTKENRKYASDMKNKITDSFSTKVSRKVTSSIKSSSAYKKADKFVKNSRTYQSVTRTKNRVTDFRKNVTKQLDKVKDAVDKASSKIRNTAKTYARKAGKTIAKAISKIVNLILSIPFVKPILIVIVLLIIAAAVDISSTTSSFIKYKNGFNPDNQQRLLSYDDYEQIEYSTWVERYKDADDKDANGKFYTTYRAIVPEDQISVISYTFKSDEQYKKILTKNTGKLLSSTDKVVTMDEAVEAYKKAIDEYYKDAADKFALRQLFIDYLDYNYQYLVREYSAWKETKTPTPSSFYVSWNQNADTFLNAQKDLMNAAALSEAQSKDEYNSIVLRTTPVKVNYTQQHKETRYRDTTCTGTKMVCKTSKIESCVEETYEYSCQEPYDYYWDTHESRVVYVDVYEYRNIIDQEWTSDITAFGDVISHDNNHGYETYNHGDNLIINLTDSGKTAGTNYTYVPGVRAEDVDWEKIGSLYDLHQKLDGSLDKTGYLYGSTAKKDVITKRIKYYKLKKWSDDQEYTPIIKDGDITSLESVQNLLIYAYNPAVEDFVKNKSFEYSGYSIKSEKDKINVVISSYMDTKDSVSFTIDKEDIYKTYYNNNSKMVSNDKMFDIENVNSWMRKLKDSYLLFSIYCNFADIQFPEGKILISPFELSGLHPHASDFAGPKTSSLTVGDIHGAIDFAVPSQTVLNNCFKEDAEVVNVMNSVPENTSGVCNNNPNSKGCHGVIGNEIVLFLQKEDIYGEKHNIFIRYYHTYTGSISWNIGDNVSSGEAIAKVGHNGKSTGPHLHFEMWIDPVNKSTGELCDETTGLINVGSASLNTNGVTDPMLYMEY